MILNIIKNRRNKQSKTKLASNRLTKLTNVYRNN